MNWKKWLTFSPYKKLWSLIGRRPWTYISRDFYHKFEYLVLVSCVTGGFYLRPVLTIRDYWIAVGILSLGFLLGHFFWGKRYIPNQRGD